MVQHRRRCGQRCQIAAGRVQPVNPRLCACILLVFACCSTAQSANDQQPVQLPVRRLQTDASADAPAEGPVPAAQVLQTTVGQQSASQQVVDEEAAASLLMQKVRCKAAAS